jgi:Tfp pilus assembly protein PilF
MNLGNRLLRFLLDPARAILLLVAVSGIAYAPVLHGDFVSDDTLLIPGRESLFQDWAGFRELCTHDYAHGSAASVSRILYRPWISATYWLEYQIDGLNPAVYHVSNLGIHLANTALDYLVLSPLISSGPALLVALLAGVSPGALYSAGWISGRTDLWVTFFSLIFLLLWQRYVQRRKPWVLLALCGCYLMAMLSKETGLLAPLLAWLLYRDFPSKTRDKHSPIPATPRGLLWLTVPVAVAFYLRQHFAGGLVAAQSSSSAGKVLIDLPEQILRHVAQLCVPISTPLYASLNWSRSLGGVLVWLAWLAILALAVLVVRGFMRRQVWAVGAIWFAMALLPIYLLGQQWRPVTYFYVYFGIAGFWLFCIEGLRQLFAAKLTAVTANPGPLILICGMCVAGYAAITWADTAFVQTELAMFTNQWDHESNSPTANLELAGVYLQSGETARGLELAKHAVEMSANDPEPARKLVEWYLDHDDLKAAAPYADRIYERGSNDCACLATLGRFYYLANHCPEAIDLFKRAFALCQPSDPVLYNFGLALLCNGENDLAEAVYSDLIRRNSRSYLPRAALALLQASRGNLVEANRLADEFRQSAPKGAERDRLIAKMQEAGIRVE